MIIENIILGIIQGMAEFLPVSSSGHILIYTLLSKVQIENNIRLQVSLHFGTLLSIIAFFYKDIILFIKGWFQSFRYIKEKKGLRGEHLVGWYIIVATIPAAIGGILLEPILEQYFYNYLSVGFMLLIGGFAFLITEKYYQAHTKKGAVTERISVKKALIIGLFQVLALVPGVSRSGITIITGLWLKINRSMVAEFSFLIAIPILLGATSKQMIEIIVENHNIFILLQEYGVGIVTSALVGYAALRFFIPYIKKNTLNIFGYYRIIIGIVLIALNFVIK